MKRTVQKAWLVVICAMLLYWLIPGIGFANVCSQGTGVPPFLSAGAKPNLLMVLDNSGSMLDAAYSDETSYCFDDTYVSTKTYGGYFEEDRWYKWVGPGTDASYDSLPPWESGHDYTKGERVYANGIIWEAITTDQSVGENIRDDIGVAWKKITPENITEWANGISYTSGDIVWSGPQLYRATTSATSNDPDESNGLNLVDDQGVTWEEIDSTWENGKSYSKDDVVSYMGSLYEAAADGTSSGTGVYDDTGVTWNLLKEGAFVAIDSNDASLYCSGASGSEKYTHNDLCLTLDTSKNPDQVSAFAARGNFLNWAMASKFDVEKKILTGGRYNYKDDLMTTEHRGCSGSRVIKQIQMDGDPGKFLSLGVRGSRYNDDPYLEDRVDSTDDTGRLEILGITNNGYATSPECQAAIEKVTNHGLNGSQNQIQSCLESFPNSSSEMTDMRPALNHSLQACWQDDPNTPEFEINNGKFSNLVNHCTALFTGEKIGSVKPSRSYHPSELRPKDGGPFICYGVYDAGVDHTNRVGYMGRVWTDSGGGFVTLKTCDPRDAAGECSGVNCCWDDGPVDDSACLNYRNNSDGYVEKCTAISGGDTVTCVPQEANNECSGVDCCWKEKNNGTIEGDSKCVNFRNNADGHVEECTVSSGNGNNETCDEWKVIANWDNGDGTCNYPDDGPISNSEDAVCTQWKVLGEWSNGSGSCEYGVDEPVEIGGGDSTGAWEEEPENTPGNGVYEAISDYCNDLIYPEVIDPSDAAGKTGSTGNVPGLLRDSELLAQTGGTYPLATMKGYIAEDTRPQGIVHTVAGDLRLGAMAFHYVGAAAECVLAAADTASKIDKYCPLNNKDGAELLVPLKEGELVTDASDSSYVGGRKHVDDLAQAINDIRATSWTPLAEAMYGALGYYTQNEEFCLNFDNGKCLDWSADDDPVQYWCQDNHILLITEGESTADINAEITAFAPTGTEDYVNTRSITCECHPDNMDAGLCNDDKFSGDTGTTDADAGTTDAQCTGSLYSSTYLDDMTWWGQNIRSLYKDRCVADPDGRETEKDNIFTHVVTTGSLTEGGDGECDPATLMQAAAVNGGTTEYYPGEDPDDLEDNLMAVLDDILSRASSGSAASVISSSRSGSGAVYQAVFWPEYEYEDTAGDTQQIAWVGNVHSLFMSAEGKMYEDTNHDGKLDETEDGDRRVMFYFSNTVNKTRGCYDINEFILTGTCPDDSEPECDATPTDEGGAGHSCAEINDINYLWSANNYLESLSDADVHTARKIFTWNDANNDGMVDDAEWFRLKKNVDWDTLNGIAAATADDDVDGNERGPVSWDFLTPGDWTNFVRDQGGGDYEYDALNALIGWLHGEDQPNTEKLLTSDDSSSGDINGNDRIDKELRSRTYIKNDKPYTWRLGDVIHSTPIVVSRPAEAYNYIYRDPTYNDFVNKWAKRRSVVYFGANDGMLHAVNAGFYFENGNQFCCTDELKADGTCVAEPGVGTDLWGNSIAGVCDDDAGGNPVPNLGEELWAYVPYNLQPHLKCLADELYVHKYFVDQEPRIFDVQIFAEEEACKTNGLDDPGCIHPGGWGTILVGAMRFGGSSVLAESLDDDQPDSIDDKREFISSFFILDITNPEVDLTAAGAEPLLLGEMTRTTEDSSGTDIYADLNYTTAVPAMVIMRDGGENAVTSKWYLALGNGPTEQSGKNTDQAKIAIFPLERLKGEMTWSTTAGSGPGTAGRPVAYTGNGKGAFRILNQEPSNDGFYELPGRFLIPKAMGIDDPADTTRDQPGFISDIISVDYNIDMTAPDNLGARYRTDAIYFGTTDGSDFAEYLDEDAPDEQFYWNGGGRLFRMVTKVLDSSNEEIASKPSEWAARWPTTEPSATQDSAGPIRMLLDVKRPITAGPSIGYDGENYWIYAGTGRFWDEMDKTDDGWCIGGASDGACWGASTDPTDEKRVQAAMFGVKEPTADARTVPSDWGWATSVTPASSDVTCKDKLFTWQTIDWDITSQDNTSLAPAEAPGQRGLMRTDDIVVGTDADATLDCFHCTTNVSTGAYDCIPSSICFPDSINNYMEMVYEENDDLNGSPTFSRLIDYIAGTGCQTVNQGLVDDHVISQELFNTLKKAYEDKVIVTGLDGWYHEFHDPRERNLGKAALLGGLLTFTSYQPFNDKCKAEGQSFLYGLHYQTGTAPQKSVFGTFDESDGSIKSDSSGSRVNPKLGLGRGLSTTPSMHVGSSDDHAAKAFIQTSTGEIIEVTQEELPYGNAKSGRQGWTDRCE